LNKGKGKQGKGGDGMCKRLFFLVLVLGMAGNAWADLRGYWKLDGDGLDSSVYGNNGVVSANVGPTTDRFGNPNSAMYFTDGLGNINVGNDASLNLTGEMTILAWAYLDTSSSVYNRRNSRILAKMDGGGGGRAWSSGIEHEDGMPVEDTANFQISSNGSDVISCQDDATIPLDQWFHYAGVYKPGEYMELYINGDLAMNVTTGVPASQYSANGVDVLIGNRPAAGDCGWYGALDEVRIYSDALTETQIEEIMAIPEPATMLMLGLGGLALIRRKR
jgi:hypothetical protein